MYTVALATTAIANKARFLFSLSSSPPPPAIHPSHPYSRVQAENCYRELLLFSHAVHFVKRISTMSGPKGRLIDKDRKQSHFSKVSTLDRRAARQPVCVCVCVCVTFLANSGRWPRDTRKLASLTLFRLYFADTVDANRAALGADQPPLLCDEKQDSLKTHSYFCLTLTRYAVILRQLERLSVEKSLLSPFFEGRREKARERGGEGYFFRS